MITWSKLRDGSWGLRSDMALVQGDVAWVQRANGSRTKAVVGRQIWAGNGVWLYAKGVEGVEGVEGRKTQKAPTLVADFAVDDFFDESAAEMAAELAAEARLQDPEFCGF